MHRDVAIVGGGLAGLVAAVAASESGAQVTLYEGSLAVGGTSIQSSGWIWAYRPDAVADSSGGAEYMRRHANVGNDLAWLSGFCDEAVIGTMQRPGLTGFQFAMDALLMALSRRIEDAGVVHCGALLAGITQGAGTSAESGLQLAFASSADGRTRQAEHGSVILAGGGYAANLPQVAKRAGISQAFSRRWIRRNAGTASGHTVDAGERAGGKFVLHRNGACYCRLTPEIAANHDPLTHSEWSTLAPAWTGPDYGVRLTAGSAGAPDWVYEDWSGSAAAWWLASAGGIGELLIPEHELDSATPYGTIREVLGRIGSRGGAVGTEATPTVRVRAGITHSLSGLNTDSVGRLLDQSGSHIPRIYAVGGDSAQPLEGMYASGLAWALVTGRAAGIHAAADHASHAR